MTRESIVKCVPGSRRRRPFEHACARRTRGREGQARARGREQRELARDKTLAVLAEAMSALAATLMPIAGAAPIERRHAEVVA
jgi:hypothetical protein